jgi:hypothetical protein
MITVSVLLLAAYVLLFAAYVLLDRAYVLHDRCNIRDMAAAKALGGSHIRDSAAIFVCGWPVWVQGRAGSGRRE